MARYIQQLRRGWKNDTRNDWAEYEKKDDHIKPLEGELVLEYDYGVPRLKIGDGIHEFSELPYMSIDSFVLPKPISITLYADKWILATDDNNEEIANTYCQVVTVDNAVITPNSKVDLHPSPEQLLDFCNLGVATTENIDGIVTVYVVGKSPIKDYTIQTIVTEVAIDSEVVADE